MTDSAKPLGLAIPVRLLDFAPIGLFTTDAAGATNWLNANWTEMTGLPLEKLMGFGWLQSIHGDDRERILEAWANSVATRGIFECEYRHVAVDGRVIWMHTRAAPILEASGSVVGYVGSCMDVSDRKRGDDERARLEHALRQSQKMQAIGALAGGIAHDFNNLLTAILGGIRLAMSEMLHDHDAVQSLTLAEDAASRAAELTQQILSLSRRDAPLKRPTQVNALVESAARLLKRTVAPTIEVVVDLDAEMPAMMLDAPQIYQVILNLGINARDALCGAGVIRYVTRRADARRPSLVDEGAESPVPCALVSVEDTGCGMSPQVVERIFEPFFTTKGPGTGTGLGLTVSYGCVRSHDGWIEVKSAVGEGTRFDVYLPVIASPVVSEEPSISHLPRGESVVLLVDDVEVILLLTESILDRLGYRVIKARTGAEALERLAATHDIEIVITDLLMPQLGGRALLQEMRRLGHGLPVMAMTGFFENISPTGLTSEGFAGVLRKPFTARELAFAVRDALSRRVDAGGAA